MLKKNATEVALDVVEFILYLSLGKEHCVSRVVDTFIEIKQNNSNTI
jgi:hypothetical protein